MAYIDRDKLLKDIEESVVFTVRGQNSLEIKGANKITDRIKNAPTEDVQKVVRCKDCRYCELIYPEKELNKEPTSVYYCKVYKCDKQPTDFCSYDKRKEVD